MNDEAGWQIISASDFRVPGLTTAERSTFGEQFSSGSAVNRAVYPAAAEKRRVSRIHNGIDFELRDITTDNVDVTGRAQVLGTEV